MKKLRGIIGIALAICLVCTGLFISVPKANADEIVVTGVIQTGSTTEIIKFKTADGEMLLKIDDKTDLSVSKNLLPGRQYSLEISYSTDNYWHIKSIKANKNTITEENYSIDKSNIVTVKGTAKDAIIDSKTPDILNLNMDQGIMSIKLDKDTDYSECTALVGGAAYTVKVAYGEDAYMHAISLVEDKTANANKTSTTNGTTENTNTTVKPELTVTGTIGDKSTDEVIYLSTSNNGVMQINLSKYTGAIRVIAVGQKYSVGIVYGNDYWYAVSIDKVNSTK